MKRNTSHTTGGDANRKGSTHGSQKTSNQVKHSALLRVSPGCLLDRQTAIESLTEYLHSNASHGAIHNSHITELTWASNTKRTDYKNVAHVHNGFFFPPMLLVGKWMQLKMFTLCELSHTQKDRSHVLARLWFLDFYIDKVMYGIQNKSGVGCKGN